MISRELEQLLIKRAMFNILNPLMQQPQQQQSQGPLQYTHPAQLAAQAQQQVPVGKAMSAAKGMINPAKPSKNLLHYFKMPDGLINKALKHTRNSPYGARLGNY